ncbi:hypothetical protein BX611_0363 [Lutibacter oceani]|uniref:Glycosyltransferase RgtA/B/C/D-like domain-containing protein n=1 Tax=Lutibacter oceani TaxID=1853311 RepID=A0A3D9RSY6_9FLAO|nr:hypothetical protein [Lutibacter oceani]REE83083.1 hypothetical protein BX611_0363 [Lutibacter oceani]
MATILNILIILGIAYFVLNSLVLTVKNADSVILKTFTILVCIAHFGATIAFLLLLDKFPNNDPVKYYTAAVEAPDWLSLFKVGGYIISFLIYPLVKLKISFEVLFLVFATLSYKGFLAYFKLIDFKKLNKGSFFLMLFFIIPSTHFWTSFLGKEALLFTLMVLLLKKIKTKTFDWILIGSLMLIFLIRPHVFFVVLLALLVVVLLDAEISKAIKRRLLFGATLGVLVLFPLFLIYFLNIKIVEINSFQDVFAMLVNYSETNGNSKIDLLNTNIFTRIAYLLFMPLPFLYNIKNMFQWMAAIENIYIVIVFIGLIIYILKAKFKFKRIRIDQKFALIASILLIVLFGSYLYNLGLGNRMRIMFLPYLFYFFITYMNSIKNNEKETS